MSNFDDFLAEQLAIPDFRVEYEALEPEFTKIQTMIDSRQTIDMTQKQPSDKTVVD